MRVVLDGRLWLGNAGDLRDPTVLDRQGIRAVVQVALEERPPQLPRELLCCHFPIVDGENEPSVVAVALEAAAALVRTATPTLICCGAGMSRSPAIAAGAAPDFERLHQDREARFQHFRIGKPRIGHVRLHSSGAVKIGPGAGAAAITAVVLQYRGVAVGPDLFDS